MAFICEDCIDPDSEWDRAKFKRGMGISFGICECCRLPRPCVHTPRHHAVDHTPDLVKLGKEGGRG